MNTKTTTSKKPLKFHAHAEGGRTCKSRALARGLCAYHYTLQTKMLAAAPAWRR
jgi:hypothetical protein